MTEWEPATEAEVAMRDALRANDQELYFRLLSRTDLLLPVSAPAQPGQAPPGWGTWTTGGRTHVLAFTSVAALRVCLGEHPGTNRRVPFADLAVAWPNQEWWLAVNPGLPIEGYLPAWFVAQLSRGDVRLPGRAMGARARLERAETLARTRTGAPGRDTTPAAGSPPAMGAPPSGPALVPPAVVAPAPAAPAVVAPTVVPPAVVPPPPVPPAPVPPAAVPPAAVPPPPFPSATVPPRRAAWGPTPPAAGTPPMPGPASRTPGPVEPPRRPGQDDVPAAGHRHPSGSPQPGAAGTGPLPRTGRSSRFAPLTPADRPGARPTESPGPGRSAESSGPGWSAESPGPGWSAESSGPGWSAGFPGPGRSAESPGTGWPAANRPSDVDGPAAGNGGPQPARRSFFEPTTARDRASDPTPGGGRPADRAAPPTRFGRGSQPFPRRRPADTPAEATRAFPMADPDATRPLRPRPGDLGASRGVRAPAPAEEITQPLPPRRPDPMAEEPTRAFRLTGEPPLSAAAERPGPAAEQTQAIPRERPSRFEPVEEMSVSAAEPVSSPPAPRRGFTPIVIEGTIIESRDLTDPVEANGLFDAARQPRPAEAAPRRFDSAPSGPDLFSPSSSTPSRSAPASTNPAPSPSVPPTSGGPAADGLIGAGTGGGHTEDRPGVPVSGDRTDIDGSSVGATSTDRPSGATGADRVGTATGADRVGAATGADRAASGATATVDGAGQPPPVDEPAPVEFEPANTVEEDLLGAAGSGSTDTFLSTLLLARVLLPAAPDSRPGSRPGDAGFVWRTAQLDDETYVVVYTSPERLADHVEGDVSTVGVKFAQLIRRWPDEDWSFAVNPGTPVGAKLPGEQIVALANWAAEVGLGDDLEVDPEEAPAVAEPTARPRYAPAAVDPTRPTVMQKAVAPSQLAYYLDRGYDRVSGFVHRAGELAHLTTPAQVHDALGLSYPGSPFARDAEEIYVLRWPAHRPSLYRIPYGGQNEPAMRAMEGWVIERPPFRGNGFAPGESSDVVAEFKVDSARLPHGTQLWRIGADGTERVVAELDTDTVVWRRVGEA
ncbi:SseB family protein [Micromonospora sp. NPDC048935]|uniref:SseB family protein n=1 Tax=Micromonospora sp. NPDC048935 TaxID=3364262 RepID=UPI00371BED7B